MSGVVLAVALASLGAARASAAEPAWERCAEAHGVVIETRDVPGASLHDLRATTSTPASVAAVLGVLWSHADFVRFLPRVKHVEVLRDTGDERLVYEQFGIPFLKDRDIVLRVQRRGDPAAGRVEIDSVAVSDAGPPERSDHVRVSTSRAHWELVARPEGGTTITYQIRADVGGYVPAWIVDQAQRQAVPDLVRAILTEAERRTR